MTKIYGLLGLTATMFVLSACGSTCYQQTSAASATLGEVVYQSNIAYDANYINVDTYGKIDKATDQARIALDTARLMCVAEDKSFKNQMTLVNRAISEGLKTLDEGKTK